MTTQCLFLFLLSFCFCRQFLKCFIALCSSRFKITYCMLNAKITARKCAQNTVDIGALHTKQYRSYIRTCSLLKNKMRLEVIYHISSCTFFSPTDVYYTTEFVFYVAGKCYDKNIDPSQQKIYRGRASLSTRWQHAIWW